MSILYIISKTDGTAAFSIEPGSLNGPGGIAPDNTPGNPATVTTSDLQLYGQGTILYGEGVNTDLFHLLESFACPAKVGTAGVPQDQLDLGIFGAGVNNPVTGQIWFNTDAKKVFVYDETFDNDPVNNPVANDYGHFITIGSPAVGPTPPDNPMFGDLWYDTSDNSTAVGPKFEWQLKIWNGIDPNDTGAVWMPVADRYLLLDGTREMHGNLKIRDSFSPAGNTVTSITLAASSSNDIIFNDENDNLVASISSDSDVNSTDRGELTILTSTGNNNMTLRIDGHITTSANPYIIPPTQTGDPDNQNTLVQIGWLDTTFVADAGGTMHGKLLVGTTNSIPTDPGIPAGTGIELQDSVTIELGALSHINFNGADANFLGATSSIRLQDDNDIFMTGPTGNTISMVAGGTISMGVSSNIIMGVTNGPASNITIYGNGNNGLIINDGGDIALNGAGNTLTLNDSGDIVLNGASNSITLNDGGDIVLNDLGNSLTLNNGGDITLNGASNSITLNDGGDIVLFGTGNSITLNDAGDINVIGGAINVSAAGTINLTGSSDINISGGGNLVMANASSSDISMNDNQINFDNIFLNEGNGSTGPDIRFNNDGVITSQNSLWLTASDGGLGGDIIFAKNAQTIIATRLMTITSATGLIRSDTPASNYVTAMGTDAQSIPNKAYVDTKISAAAPVIFNGGTPSGMKNGDIWVNGATIYIYAVGWRQIFPALYS